MKEDLTYVALEISNDNPFVGARNCSKCGLLEISSGPVDDDGTDRTILAVGEAPGEKEDLAGRPFVGQSGRLLRQAMTSVGFPMDRVTFTNIVKCRPPDNKIKPKYIECCYQSLEISEETRMVLLFGATALRAVLGESGIMSWNGVIVERDGIIYVPLLHPAYLLRNDQSLDGWLDALEDALEAFEKGIQPPADEGYERIYPVSIREIYLMCKGLMGSPVISFDTEFSYLDAYHPENRILVMSFANDKRAWAVPINHPDDLVPISDQALDSILNVLEAHPNIIGHNIKMDQMQVDALLGCKFDAKGDSRLASFLLESKEGLHGLKRLAGYYLGMFEYDRELSEYIQEHPEADPERRGTYANIPLDILLPYAASDAIATYQLHQKLVPMLTEKQQALYHELMIPTSNALYRMQVNGMAVDQLVAKRYEDVYGWAIDNIMEGIQSNRHVQEFVEDRKAELEDNGKKREAERFKFNPGSSPQRSKVLYGYCHLKPLGKTDNGSPSTKRDYLEPYRAKNKLVDNLIMYSMLKKMMGTYIEPVSTGSKLSGDGRARSSFNQHVVETGRLSSSRFTRYLGFNQQNIPVPEKEPGTILEYQPIKNLFTHTFDGGCLMSVDYSGMELRVFASLAKCEPMLEIHRSGRDFHTMVGSMVSGKPYDKITKEERYRYKWTNWTALYVGSERTLNRLYGIPLEEGREILDRYYEEFPEVLEYREECIEFAREHGYIETPFGLRRPLPYILSENLGMRSKAEREAVNTPVQNGAGMVTLMALSVIDKVMRELDLKSMLIDTVHDSTLSDVFPGELDSLAALQVKVMENIVTLAGRFMPDIDMSWLICPLKADVEVGSHYGSLEKYEVSLELMRRDYWWL